ncbi:MAG TPA: phosphoribosylanthranilate isomerase [Gemmatales bacterium]|nr:phosphoribosylanthranilate isomerase [Gemmatales bacterium]
MRRNESRAETINANIIKICGLTTEHCVECCLAAGVQTVGLNFYQPSPRAISIETAKQLRKRLPASMQVVGVFVRPTAEELLRTVQEVGLDVVQLHGTEDTYWRDFVPPPVPLWLAQGIESLTDVEQLKTQMKLCRAMNVAVSALLVDAKFSGKHGGTGQLAPWHLLQETTWDLPVVLAGGLEPGNVRMAIDQVKPSGVDVASGVESSPGVKDGTKVAQFVRNARSAYLHL